MKFSYPHVVTFETWLPLVKAKTQDPQAPTRGAGGGGAAFTGMVIGKLGSVGVGKVPDALIDA